MNSFNTYYIDAACRYLGYPLASSYFDSKPSENNGYFIGKVTCGPDVVDSYESCIMYRWYDADGPMVYCPHVTGIVCYEGELMLK